MSQVIIDSREPMVVQAGIISDLPQGAVKFQALDSGDIVIRDKDDHAVSIERKAISDLLGSLADKRVWAQVERMKREYEYPFLLIEGEWSINSVGKITLARRKLTGWSHGAVQMALVKIQTVYGVGVLYTQSLGGTVDVVRCFYNRGIRECFHASYGTPAAIDKLPASEPCAV